MPCGIFPVPVRPLHPGAAVLASQMHHGEGMCVAGRAASGDGEVHGARAKNRAFRLRRSCRRERHQPGNF